MENKTVYTDFSPVIERIRQAQNRVFQQINSELVNLYWDIGKYVSEKVNAGKWGDGVVKQLADHIRQEYPNLKGFTKRGLYRMKQFYETYNGIENVSAVLTQMSWTNHITILSKCKSIEEKQFYLLLAVKDRLSSRELIRQIDTGIFERTMLSKQNVSASVAQLQKSVGQIFKDTYVFEFLDLPENYTEKDLQKNLVENLKNFMLEIGGYFSFVGQEYRVQVGMHDYFIDLVFFHRELQSLVAVELKTTEFKPEYLGQLNFYLEALDSNIKLPQENPSIGILLCKNKDSEVVEFALRRNLSPAVIAEYETKLINKKLLQQKLHEFYELYQNKMENDNK
jgi:predicted nuclease of restriction endonuclease-like (RecB) superfamily